MVIRLPPKKQAPASAISSGPVKTVIPASTDLLTVKESAAFVKVAEITIRRWLGAKLIPHFKAGKQIRINKADLVAFLDQQ